MDTADHTSLPGPPAAPRRPKGRRRSVTGADLKARRRRIARYVLVIVSTVLLVNALIGEKGYLATLQAQREHDALASALDSLKAENSALTEEVRRLRHDPARLEAVARQDLGLIRPGETLITLRDRPRSQD